MIGELRRKFIRITMTTVLAVLMLILIAINCVNLIQNNQSLDSITKMLLDNDGTFNKNKLAQNKNKPYWNEENSEFRDRFHNRAELPFSTRFFTIRLDNKREVTAWDLSSIASVSEEEVGGYTERILAKGRSVGWLKTYRYRIGRVENGYLIIVMDATNVRSSMRSVLVITLLVGLAAFLLVFLFVALFSGRAIKPISETYDKQKQFITDASHELKTPLTVISANAEVLSMTCGENEWCEGIIRQTEHMRALIGKMIQMSKLDEGEQTLVFAEFNLSDAVYDTAMSFGGLTEAKGLRLHVDVASGIRYKGDEASIRHVVSILVDNSVKYCDQGGEISVRLAREGKGISGKKIILSVRNTYADIALLDIEKLFERFYRADLSHSVGGSYGLGLPIAKGIVELHGGRIGASDRHSGEIEFYVAL